MWAGPVITTNVVFLPAALRRPFIQSWMIIQKRQHQETYADIVDVRLDIAVLRPMGLDIVLSLKPVYTLQYLSTRSNTCLHAPISVYTLQYLSTRSNTCLHALLPVYTLYYLSTRSNTCLHAPIPVCTLQYLSTRSNTCLHAPIPVYTLQYLSTRSNTCVHALLPVDTLYYLSTRIDLFALRNPCRFLGCVCVCVCVCGSPVAMDPSLSNFG